MKAQQLAITSPLSSIRYDNMDIELLAVRYFSLDPLRSVEETTWPTKRSEAITVYGPGSAPMQLLYGEML